MLEKDFLIISNNSLVKDLDEMEISLLPGNVPAVISRAFSLAAVGHRLLSHPLMGSIKPNQNPFKSILMSRQMLPVDQPSLTVLNTCLEKTEAMLENRPLLHIQDEVANDYQLLDFELLLTAIHSLSKGR